MELTKENISQYFNSLQDSICTSLEQADGKARFIEDKWERPGGGGGRSRVMNEGAVIEKGGVNFSAVYGKLPDTMRKALDVNGAEFFATGVSIVIHPGSPMVPIIHMNVRYFEMDNGLKWFGGGIDLTPIYVLENDARFFHGELKRICDRHNKNYYPEFKKWADDYFFIKHRNETRGIGGIFFDRLFETTAHSISDRFLFVKEVGELFAPTYVELISRNKDKLYSTDEKQWQLIRRGRYVEFNLVYDKGTKFGLETDGRTESILMSLPKEVNWIYDHKVARESREEKTLSLLKKGIDWIS